MNEFYGKTKEQLEKIKFGLELYNQGIKDTWKIIDEMFEKTINMYEQKIHLCDIEIKK